MSISPKTKDEEGIKNINAKKAEYFIKKSVSFFWTNPLKYLFYLTSFIFIIGSVVGKEFPITFYVMFFSLMAVEFLKELIYFFHPELKLLDKEK